MNQSVAQCRFLLSVAERILAGLGDSHRALEPALGAKTAGWLIGHLAVTGDFARSLCGRSPLCPTEWPAAYNPGSQPSAQPTDYPSMATLCDTFRAVYSDLCGAASSTDPQTLEVENPYAPARAVFPTAGAFLAYLLAGHLGYHLGQLVAWRAAAGLGRLQRPEVAAA